MSSRSLGEELVEAQRCYDAWANSSLSAIDPDRQLSWDTARLQLEKLCQWVDQAGLFSDNEDLEDISTPTLRFLRAPALLGDLFLGRVGGSRKESLLTGKRYHELFIRMCQQYALLKDEDKRRMERIKATSVDALQGIVPRPPPSADAATRRATKIAQFHREKACKEAIKELENKEANLKDGQEEEQDEQEDVMRDLLLLTLDLQIQRSLEALESVNEEMPMVIEMEKMRGPGGSDDRDRQRQGASNEDRLDERASGPTVWTGPILTPEGRPNRPFVITSKREELQAGVFRPSWRLPTMSIDEYLEEEMRRGNMISGGGEESGRITEIDEDDEEAADAATFKARDWDEFLDANPRGSGNRIGKG